MGLDAVLLVMTVEEAFGIDIPDRDVRTIGTAGQLRDYVMGRTGREPEDVWSVLVDILEREFGVERQRIVPGARIVGDLGLD